LAYSFFDFKVWHCIFFTLLFFAYWPFASQSTIPTIDEVVVSMTDIDPVRRLDAKEAKDRLGTIFYSMAPESLLIRPDIAEHDIRFITYKRELFYIKLRLQ
jgi:hypothetical protein